MRNRGFTLVELLVVIAVVVLLMAIMVPTISRMIANAQTAECLNNLKQIGLAAQNYAGEYNFRLPAAAADERMASWLISREGDYDEDGPETGSLYKFLNNPRSYRCPSADDARNSSGDWVEARHSYAMNIKLSYKPMTSGGDIAQKVIFMVEESPETLLRPETGGSERFGAFEKADRTARYHPSDKTNVLYMDLHAITTVIDPKITAEDQMFSRRDPEGIKTPLPGEEDAEDEN